MLTVTGKILTRSYEHTMERLCRSYFTRSTCTLDKMIKWVVLLIRMIRKPEYNYVNLYLHLLVYATLMMITSYMETQLSMTCVKMVTDHTKNILV